MAALKLMPCSFISRKLSMLRVPVLRCSYKHDIRLPSCCMCRMGFQAIVCNGCEEAQCPAFMQARSLRFYMLSRVCSGI